jgi:hypothetical protein
MPARAPRADDQTRGGGSGYFPNGAVMDQWISGQGDVRLSPILRVSSRTRTGSSSWAASRAGTTIGDHAVTAAGW